MKGITPDFSSFEILTIAALPLTHYRNSQRLLVPTKILKVFLFLPKEQPSFQSEQKNPNFSTEECLRSLCPTCDLYLASRTSKSLHRQTTRFLPTRKNTMSVSKWMQQTKNEPKPQFLTLTCAYDRFENFPPTLRPAKCLPTPRNPNLRLEISLWSLQAPTTWQACTLYYLHLLPVWLANKSSNSEPRVFFRPEETPFPNRSECSNTSLKPVFLTWR